METPADPLQEVALGSVLIKITPVLFRGAPSDPNNAAPESFWIVLRDVLLDIPGRRLILENHDEIQSFECDSTDWM